MLANVVKPACVPACARGCSGLGCGCGGNEATCSGSYFVDEGPGDVDAGNFRAVVVDSGADNSQRNVLFGLLAGLAAGWLLKR